MPLPDLDLYCVRLSATPRLCVTLPGGAPLCVPWPSPKVPDPYEYSLAAMGMVNVALAPLIPFFNMLDVVVAAIDCIKAVEKALGPPPDPSKLVQCFPKLAKALAKLMQLIPQLVIPIAIGQLLDIVILYLTGLRTQLLTILRKQLRLLRSEERAQAIGSVQLQTALDCATLDLDAFLDNLNDASLPVARLLMLVNLLLEIAGMEPIPTVQAIGADAQKALGPLEDTIDALTTVRKLFP
jgi:uncharacterized membrane protein (DUF2068 family)